MIRTRCVYCWRGTGKSRFVARQPERGTFSNTKHRTNQTDRENKLKGMGSWQWYLFVALNNTQTKLTGDSLYTGIKGLLMSQISLCRLSVLRLNWGTQTYDTHVSLVVCWAFNGAREDGWTGVSGVWLSVVPVVEERRIGSEDLLADRDKH